MKFEELKDILKKENISSDEYSVLGPRYLKAYDGFVISVSAKRGYKFEYFERGKWTLLADELSESEACNMMIENISSERVHSHLKKYLE